MGAGCWRRPDHKTSEEGSSQTPRWTPGQRGTFSGSREAKLGHTLGLAEASLVSGAAPQHSCPVGAPPYALPRAASRSSPCLPDLQSIEGLCGGRFPTSTCSWPWRATASSSDSPTQPYSSGVKTVVGTWKVGLESDMLSVCCPPHPLSQVENASPE